MKFKIKYADQIVGFFSIFSIFALIVLIFAIGAKQSWFTKKNNYYTVFDSGSGISVGMDLTYKGFSIGKVKSVSLQGDFVRVDYYVLEDYFSYVKENSIVELSSSPIGLGSSFVLHPGIGKKTIPSGKEIYRKDSDSAQELIEAGLVKLNTSGDSISELLAKVSSLLDNVNILVGAIDDAFLGKGDAPFTEIIGNVNKLTKQLSDENGMLPNVLGPQLSIEMIQMLDNVNILLSGKNGGAVPKLLGKEISREITAILSNLTPITANADKLVGNAVPEVNELLNQVNVLLLQVQDLVKGVNNNPLIRGGIPDRSNTGSASTNSRKKSDF